MTVKVYPPFKLRKITHDSARVSLSIRALDSDDAGAAPVPQEAPLQAHHLPEHVVLSALSEGKHEEILKAHFGDAFEDIRDAVKHIAARAQGKKRRRVLMLPGLMSSLIGIPKGDRNHVQWLDPLEVAAGSLLNLAFDRRPRIGASVGPLLPFSLPLKLRLQLADHDVDIFSYDWRYPVEDIAALVAKKIIEDKSAKVTLVCHSLGCLVARAAMKNAAVNAKVEMVVVMGGPHLGAPAMSQGIRGSYPAMKPVLDLDVKHTWVDYGRLMGTFPGVYWLLPPRGTQFGIDLRDRGVWPGDGAQPDAALLASCGSTRDALLPPDGRFFCIAGANVDTVTAVRKQGDDFVYEYSMAGDGTVPIDSAVSPGLTQAWFADGVAHDKLCAQLAPCDAAAAILDGKSPDLPTKFTARKAGVTKTETDASLNAQRDALGRIVGDARHVAEAMHAAITKGTAAAEAAHAGLKNAGSWLRKHL